MENPYEPKEPGPTQARARAPQRRGADYHLPPIGSGRHLDQKHLDRQEWMGRLMIAMFLVVPVVYVIGCDQLWW